MTFSSKVKPNYSGLPLPEYLAKRFTYRTIDDWREHIAAGRITRNGVVADASAQVRTDDMIVYDPPAFTEPEADLAFSITYEDEWLLGVNKPGNLLVHRAGKAVTHNLMYLLRTGANGRAFPHAGSVNRLDRETSGLVMIAKTPEALTAMNRLLAARMIAKEYLAVVEGSINPPAGVIDHPVGKDPVFPTGCRQWVDVPGARSAVTRYETIRMIGERHSLVRLFPETGRTHQVRVHLAWSGHPIAGDSMYSRSGDARQPRNADGKIGATHGCRELIFRQALHCARLVFQHPFTERECVMNAGMPDDMVRLCRALDPGFEP